MRTLGQDGVAEMVERHCALAQKTADGLRGLGFEVVNRVVLSQVRWHAGATTRMTAAIRLGVEQSGQAWFGGTGVPDGVQQAFRINGAYRLVAGPRKVISIN